MPKKKRPSFPKILFGILGTTVLWIVVVFIPAGIQIYEFFGGTINMLNQIPSWAFFVPLFLYIVCVVVRAIYEYRKELREYNSSNQPARTRKTKSNKVKTA
jgi:uncharacterized membrane protein YbhN (UPF0104 family)